MISDANNSKPFDKTDVMRCISYNSYLKNRNLFELRYSELKDIGYLGNVYIDVILKGFKFKDLFFKIYSYDRFFNLTQGVSSIDKHKRFKTWENSSGSKISNININRSRINTELDFNRFYQYIS